MRIGYIVMDSCEDWEQGLTITKGEGLPKEGILTWRERENGVTLFPTYRSAQKAITRTHHYVLAFDRDDLPQKVLCKIVPVEKEPPPE